ncbi:hypothetical protein H112_08306 [Trichophyton rubrum D6]|uniref:Uncharacterized protein n=1 Tax=Trichophyton rubrum CBS 288.86 TaxID=1215330 RepID=A0A022VQB8_TRIRU|nr:hypothetical protein H102_08288 [Trichophyton rubrum CBS 100081]EZF47963.1 hypothetical protein H103_08311 [Trichophyton rubrum CBS 288.86]EZF90476.1 hypothetical protein H113_08380 [Trichophyton rubrum MR1459]EZG12084.1 hypothetical protein H107_08459 [Trichophyton rubrum CBS 202.88]KDB29027.1 hypothetical protein H112_08306 [Trichophyton rubrum D6]
MEPVDPSCKTNLRLKCRKSDPHPPLPPHTAAQELYLYLCWVILGKKFLNAQDAR